jgi:hypothetical protein
VRQGDKAGDVWFFGINLMNLDNIVVQNVVVVNVPSFHFRFSNVGNVKVSGCEMRSSGLSTDGLHFDGPANDITISDCEFTTGDDSIALNCPEGCWGSISRVAVTNCKFSSLSLMRLYTQNGYPDKFTIDTVSVSNCSGTLSEAAFLIGLANGSLPNSVASLAVSDCTFTAPAILAIAENFGVITLTNVTFTPTQIEVIWVHPQANTDCGFSRPSPLYGNITSTGSSLSFDNCTIYRTTDIDAAAVILENNSSIANLAFNGFVVKDAGSYGPMHELVTIGSGRVEQLVIQSLNSSNIKAPVSAGGFSSVGSVSGSAVLATGWEFPDSVMSDGVPFISANTGLPSIKVDGVVESYP